MKRKELEKILDEREARSEAKKRWGIYNRNTSLLIYLLIALFFIATISICILESYTIIKATGALKNSDDTAVVFGLFINLLGSIALIIFGIVTIPEKLSVEIREYRKQKFAEKFPDDAKYLE